MALGAALGLTHYPSLLLPDGCTDVCKQSLAGAGEWGGGGGGAGV